MLALLPAFLSSLSPQLILGRYLGDRTDEGVDARTTYQFLAAMFGSFMIWPFCALIGTGLIWMNASDVSTVLSVDILSLSGLGLSFTRYRLLGNVPAILGFRTHVWNLVGCVCRCA